MRAYPPRSADRCGGRWRSMPFYLMFTLACGGLLLIWIRNHHNTSSAIHMLLHEQANIAKQHRMTDVERKAIAAGLQHAAEIAAVTEHKKRQQALRQKLLMGQAATDHDLGEEDGKQTAEHEEREEEQIHKSVEQLHKKKQQQQQQAQQQQQEQHKAVQQRQKQQQETQQQQQRPSPVAAAGTPGLAKPMSLQEALAEPVLVSIMTAHFFGEGYARNVPDCKYEGHPITCNWQRFENPSLSDVLWYHGCPSRHSVRKFQPSQLQVLMYMESAAYYPCLDEPDYLDLFDLEMTYRLCSHVPVHYFDFNLETIRTRLFAPPVPFEEKKDGVAYVNSNCQALSQRDSLVKALMDTGKIPVHAFGSCLRNQNVTGPFDKITLFSGYKFCIAMENSIAKDYMTEKLWNAFTAGCVPIYLGPSNTRDFLPADNSIVMWSDYSNADAVADELVRLMNNKTAYEEKLRWKHVKHVKELNLGIRQLMGMDAVPSIHSQCKICQVAVANRINPQNFTSTHCLRNTTWLNNPNTSWTPPAVGLAALADAYDFKLPG